MYRPMAAVRAEPSEYAAATTGVAWADLSSHELVRVSGPDAVSFVQGMVTNDVVALADGQACEAAMLTPKGATVSYGRVARVADALLFETDAGRGQGACDFLNKYLISEDAVAELDPRFAVLALVGPGAAERAAQLPHVARLPSSLGTGVDLLVPRDAWPQAVSALAGVPQLSPATQDVLRIEAGLPRLGVELTETTIPLEANLERAIHFKKGCYIGQEVIARATFRGQLNKRLQGLLLGTAEPAPTTELRVQERKVGWLTSVAFSPALGQVVALGYVHRDFLTPGVELTLATGGVAVVRPLPLVAAA